MIKNNIVSVRQCEHGYIVNGSFFVAFDESNTDYLDILNWITAGNIPEQYIEPEPTYQELRQAEYPSLAEQLDMQYWDSMNGTTVWADTIQAVKDKYPKPEGA